jgi:hypothetical protein
MRPPVSRPVDAIVLLAIFAPTIYLAPLLSFREKLILMGLMALASVALFFLDRSIGSYYLSFITVSLSFTALSLKKNSTRLSLAESARYFRSMLRHEPSPEEARLLAAIRADRNLSKT